MKKLALTLAIILGIALGASAQNGGLFGKGPSRDMDYEYGSREGEGPMINLPGSHGTTNDESAPLGGGIALLTGLGAAYLVAKKRKNTKRGAMMALLALLAFGPTAWAQNNWDEVYALTQTTSANWAALGSGSTTGWTIGSAGNTTYYYATGNLSFTNSNDGGSGLTILGTVYLYIPNGVTVTCTGHNASGTTGAGAGVELAAGNTLYLLGGGTINATGGNAADGTNGSNGDNSNFVYNNYCQPGSGGAGGNGGGGAGAGIGTRGGNGGNGGNGGAANRDSDEGTNLGVAGSAGSAGATAGSMGTLYVNMSISVNVTGGSAGTGGTGGNRGYNAAEDPGSQISASGGGGGGAGGGGGFANNIGTGGPGGGGGGGGAAGNSAWRSNYYPDVFFKVGAGGGSGGQNADGTYTANGVTSELTSPYNAEYQGGLTLNNYKMNYYEEGNGQASGGGSGSCGGASQSGSAINLVYWPTQGAGTEESPYLISSVNEWNTFVTNVSNGNSYSGQYVKLTNDISVTTMAGGYQDDDNYQPFSGIFDGDGHTLTLNVSNQSRFAAPFKCVSGATIRNLRTAGTIDGTGNADGKLLAGIIGVSFGNTTITGCRSSVTLTTAFGEDAALAGLVAGTKGGSLTIEGCVFDGSMTGSSNTRCAGIAGFEYTATTTTISNCLFTPTTLTVSTTDDNFTKTFTRDGDATLDRCYYTQTLGAAQGTQATVSASAPATLGSLLHDYGMVKAYAGAILFNGNYYYDANAITSESTSLSSGTYTVYTDVEVPSRITISGSVTINLAEGATLHAPKGIDVSIGNSLIINGPGTLTIDGCDIDKAGIGATNVGTLTINSGIINVRGGSQGAGIGGNAFNDGGGTITINGGIVNANGGYGAAGIGGGICGGTSNYGHGTGMCGNVYIYGGQVTAVGGSMAAGIGPGVCTSIYLYPPISGNLTIGWTNPEDFLYNSGFYSQNGNYNETLNGISFVEGKQFIIEGLGEIANPSSSTNFGSRKILPLVDQATALPGSGSLIDPYRISNLSDWMKLAVNVNGGTKNYSGEYVRLENDLSVSIMVGKDETNSFQGTFLGNNKTLTFSYSTWEENTAPFRVTNNATIKDLKVAGSISTSAKFAAGLASRTFGTTSITNCQVDTYIHSNINGDGTHGGIVAMPSGTLNIEGCAFTGRLLTNNGTHSCGGFVGWHNSSTISVINSLYAPSSSIPSGWSAITGGATFVRGGSPTINNCYYTEKLGDVQGSLVLVYPSDPGNLGNEVQAYSTLTAYTNGIFCDDIYYLKAATFSGAGNEGSPYLISNEFEWKSFAAYVNSGSNTYSGKYMKLTADISVTEMVGSSEGNSFQGTLLGNGHTITAALNNDDYQGLAPFRYIDGATIKNLKVAGTIASSQYHSAGVVGFASGTNTIEGCVVTATLNISNNYAGGIIGHGLSSNTTIRGCVFAGTINGVGDDRENIGGIWGWSNSGTPTLEDCLEAGTYTNIASMHPMGLQKAAGAITNCYYVTPKIGEPSNACTVSGAVQALTDEEIQPLGEPVATYSTSGINVYANGISYGGNFYYHPDKNIKLTVQGYGNSTESDHWAFIASPVAGSIGATAVSNLEADNATDFDLYRFNPSADLEWENWKQEGNHHHFNLENGQGYLYATKETKTLVFSGMFNTGDTKPIENLPQGFNLVGNPFTVDAYVSKPYYTLNEDGSVIVAQPNGTTTPIAPCHGVIVKVDGNESVTFSKTAPAATANQGLLNITVSEQKADTRGASTGSATAIDNAIVRFGEGEQLGKFHFGNPSANISIPQGGKEYAVANVSTNEIPVNFKASKNGEYTISFNPENVEFDYLHLIDNLTGSDVNLLQTPSHTFTARNDDYESRFRLVFVANNADLGGEGNDDFAFISNGQLIITGEGLLQVFDVLGHQLFAKQAPLTSHLSPLTSPGVYVLRLINGENVKTQKIVVR